MSLQPATPHGRAGTDSFDIDHESSSGCSAAVRRDNERVGVERADLRFG